MRIDPSRKILTLSELLLRRKQLRDEGQKLILTNGCFDILHRGHIQYLWGSSSFGDVLTVAINSDESVRQLKGNSRPVNSVTDRAYVLAALEFVDWVFVFAGPSLADEIAAIEPDIYTKGGDYTVETLNQSERRALERAGAAIHFVPLQLGYSTTETIHKSKERKEND